MVTQVTQNEATYKKAEVAVEYANVPTEIRDISIIPTKFVGKYGKAYNGLTWKWAQYVDGKFIFEVRPGGLLPLFNVAINVQILRGPYWLAAGSAQFATIWKPLSVGMIEIPYSRQEYASGGQVYELVAALGSPKMNLDWYASISALTMPPPPIVTLPAKITDSLKYTKEYRSQKTEILVEATRDDSRHTLT